MWWKTFATHWNGCSLIIHKHCQEHRVTSDALGLWGCGAWYNEKMVPTSLGHLNPRIAYCSEGDDSNNNSSGDMGCQVDKGKGNCPV